MLSSHLLVLVFSFAGPCSSGHHCGACHCEVSASHGCQSTLGGGDVGVDAGCCGGDAGVAVGRRSCLFGELLVATTRACCL